MTDATEPQPEGEAATLRQDVACILIECHRDRVGDGIFHANATGYALAQFAAHIARRLAPLIGGRYVPKGDTRRAERDAAVWQAFNGRNHPDVMREFCISRRLLYSILARKRRAGL